MGFWDPAKFTLDVSESQYKFYQEAELKHSRVAMLAFAGIIVGELINPLFDGQITGPAAFQYQIADDITGGKFTIGVLLITAWLEGQAILDIWCPPEETFSDVNGVAKLRPDHVAGDLKFDPLGLMPNSAEKIMSIKNKELNNGRLAMIATAGAIVQECVTGTPIF